MAARSPSPLFLSDEMIHWGVVYWFARSAAKHGISQERAVYVIEHCGLPFGFPEYPDTIMHLGDDERGVALEVGAVTADPETLVVRHPRDATAPQVLQRLRGGFAMENLKSTSGLPLTEEALQQRADYLEHKLEPSDLRPRPVGRPSLSDSRSSPRIYVRVPRPLHRVIAQRAHEEGTTVSMLVRRLLEQYAAS